ncbi:MAG: hypothetical protein HON65_11720 [Rhodospirillales bacterium]|jgi:hypothetical protein|nr:hypothetical protein [Rhodospirillales bacterium]
MSEISDEMERRIEPEPINPERRTGMERRMVHRLLVHWRKASRDESIPLTLEAILNQDLGDITPLIFVLIIPTGNEEPVFESIGESYLSELNSDLIGQSVSSVPDETLLQKASYYYDRILDKKVPTTLGGEFINAKGETVLYRSIITPLKGDDDNISKLLGAANCKVKKT